MEKVSRKELRRSARGVLKRHYWFLVFVCLVATVLGTEFHSALNFTKIGNYKKYVDVSDNLSDAQSAGLTSVGLDGAYDAVVEDQIDAYKDKIEQENENKHYQVGLLEIGRTRGVLATVMNHINSSSLFLMGYSAINGITGTKYASMVIITILAFIVYALFWIFIAGVYKVIMGRIFLEARIYDKVPTVRFIYLFRIRRWFQVSLALFRKTVYELLWMLTIVGGVIKRYSYFCVPYILAENPKVTGKEAILLSRKMMNGHKMEAFLLEFSFILWDMLSAITLGLLGLFYVNPYKTAAYAEFYTKLRDCWKKEGKEGSELLNDTYLYEKADQALLDDTYSEIEVMRAAPQPKFMEGHKFARFMALNFGVILRHDEEERKYLRSKGLKQRIKNFDLMIDGKMYPNRLTTIPEEEKDPVLEGIGYERCYTIVSLILIFFAICIVGWLWEVSLHIISDHCFRNRGVLHGPWLPIYGSGGMVILLLLNRFRKKVPLEFVLSMVLAGGVEYFTSWNLERTYGEHWWNYTGYFLNLHGRVCAEGLLIFGLGGLAIVYLVAPLLDNQFRKLPRKTALIICAVLLTFYVGDSIYSHFHPNKGDGITNYNSETKHFRDYSKKNKLWHITETYDKEIFS